jgi:hypothetical protein
MKKTAYVLGYAGSVLALVFSMLMILTVPLALWDDVLADVANGRLKSEHVLAINNTAIEIGSQNWTDYSERGLRDIAEQAAKEYEGDPEIYDKAAQYAYKFGLNAMISMIVVAAAIVLAILALIGALIVRKAPTAGGVLLLIAAFFLLLASIYTGTLMPTFIASVVLALGGIAVFIPARGNRPVPAPSRAARQPAPQGGYAPQYAPPQGGYAPQYAPPQGGYAPQYAPPQGGYAPQYAPPQGGYAPQYAPPQNEYAPPQNGYAPPVVQDYTVPDNAAAAAPAEAVPVKEAAEPGNPLPFPEETEKPRGEA